MAVHERGHLRHADITSPAHRDEAQSKQLQALQPRAFITDQYTGREGERDRETQRQERADISGHLRKYGAYLGISSAFHGISSASFQALQHCILWA